jgi:hypothetical protein
MPLRINKRCKICQVIENDEAGAQLLKRLYASAKFRIDGEPLTRIHADYANQFSYLSLTNHLKKHQTVRASDLKRTLRKEIAEQGANTIGEELLATDNVRQEIMSKGLEGIRDGSVKIRASDVIKAAKDQDDVQAKRGDQALMAAELMMRIASGELTPIGEPDGETTRTSIEGQVVTPTGPTQSDSAPSSTS